MVFLLSKSFVRAGVSTCGIRNVRVSGEVREGGRSVMSLFKFSYRF